MLLNTTKFLCPKTNGIWFFVWENYQVREEIHHTVNVVQWSKMSTHFHRESRGDISVEIANASHYGFTKWLLNS